MSDSAERHGKGRQGCLGTERPSHSCNASHDGAGDREGRCAALHGRWRLQPPQWRWLRRSWEVCWLESRPGSSPAQLSSQARLRGSDCRAWDYTLLWQSVDLQPCSLWNQQICDVQVPDRISGHPLGLHCGYPVCYPQLSAHLDPDAFCEDLPNGLAFRADNMEECDRRCHWPIVYKCGPQLLIGQHATEPRLTTQTLGRSRHLDTVQLYWCNKLTTVLFTSQLLKLFLKWNPDLSKFTVRSLKIMIFLTKSQVISNYITRIGNTQCKNRYL